MNFPHVETVLVDLRNFSMLIKEIAEAVASATLCGLDIETHNANAHPGIQKLNDGGKLVFDVKRTVVTGMSVWPDNHPRAYYFNFAHADTDNNLPWSWVKPILGLKRPEARWVIHNAAFERTMLAESLDWDIERYVCTLQMAVSAYGPDEYDINVFNNRGLADMGKLVPEIIRVSRNRIESAEMQEVLAKIIAKESDAAHSYNGYIKQIAYGYGLKQAVRSFFGYEMTTYEQVLGGKEHMGQLTGAEVVAYGCDDAIWCVRLYHQLLRFMLGTNPAVIKTFFEQELPMVEVYSEVWRTGVRIDAEAVRDAEQTNRLRYAETVSKLRHAIRAMLPFPAAPHAYMQANEKWYPKNGPKYRKLISDWASLPDAPTPFAEAHRLKGPIADAWALDQGAQPNEAGLNLAFYMGVRVIIYDLFQVEEPLVDQGKVQSDGWARGRLKEKLGRAGETAKADIIGLLGEIATIEQAQKLYLTPYQKLVDPDTDRLHPQLTSELATRRTAMKEPNAQQLAKRGESVYVRGFYLADDDESVIVSLDWSQIELVTIGEISGDPEFLRCFSKLPYEDLHIVAASGCLDVSEDQFRALASGSADVEPHLLVNPRGEMMDAKSAYKYWRTEVGKGSNFEFWYSGMLRNVGEKMGWSREKMFEMSDRYKARFSVAEAWRVDTINEAKAMGFVTLPDRHRRVRYEATPTWGAQFRAKWAKFDSPEINWFADRAAARIQARSGNQIINSLIQGTCATLLKRSIQRIRKACTDRGWGADKVRFMLPIHDEVVFSVKRELVTDFIVLARSILRDHPDLFTKTVLDCSPSVGFTLSPWHKDKARLGQIELNEAPAIDCVPTELVGKALPQEMWALVVDWLFAERERAR